MRQGIADELHSLPWTSDREGAHVARAAIYISGMQAEAGFCCPVTMTFAAVPALRAQPEIAAEWEPLLMSTSYDPELKPVAEKGSAICGMAMTEKQGGSDVRANTTRATPVNGGGPGAEYLIDGHKWFCSRADVRPVPRAGADRRGGVVLCPAADPARRVAQRRLPAPAPEGQARQPVQRQLARSSSAARGRRMLGEPGRGVPTIIEMVDHTRLDCAIGAAAGMRAGVAMASWHAAHRSAFGKLLADQPLMLNVLADLAIEAEAATALAMRLARAYDEDDDCT